MLSLRPRCLIQKDGVKTDFYPIDGDLMLIQELVNLGWVSQQSVDN